MSAVCCVGSPKKDLECHAQDYPLSQVEEAVISANEAKEIRFWRLINNFFAILVIAFASFIWGFYA